MKTTGLTMQEAVKAVQEGKASRAACKHTAYQYIPIVPAGCHAAVLLKIANGGPE